MTTLKDWLKKWNLDSLNINTGFLSAEITFNNADKKAAWEMYVELLTRTTTQYLDTRQGDEKTALTSIFSLFGLTREVIKKNGVDCIAFAKIAVVILNQVIRPFTTKWHKENLTGAFDNTQKCEAFRKELYELQNLLRNYTQLLADMAEVEDLTQLENL